MKVFSVLKVGTQNGAPALLCEQVDQGIFQPTTKTPDVQWLSCTINRFAQCVLSKCNSSDVSSVASPTASVKASERVVVPRMPRTTAFMVLATKKVLLHLTVIHLRGGSIMEPKQRGFWLLSTATKWPGSWTPTVGTPISKITAHTHTSLPHGQWQITSKHQFTLLPNFYQLCRFFFPENIQISHRIPVRMACCLKICRLHLDPWPQWTNISQGNFHGFFFHWGNWHWIFMFCKPCRRLDVATWCLTSFCTDF